MNNDLTMSVKQSWGGKVIDCFVGVYLEGVRRNKLFCRITLLCVPDDASQTNVNPTKMFVNSAPGILKFEIIESTRGFELCCRAVPGSSFKIKGGKVVADIFGFVTSHFQKLMYCPDPRANYYRWPKYIENSGRVYPQYKYKPFVRLPEICDNMFYVFDYFPKNCECSSRDARIRKWIWDVKDSDINTQLEAVSIIEKSISEISKVFTEIDNIALVAVPSSKKHNPLQPTSMQQMIRMLVKKHKPTPEQPENYIDCSFLLKRIVDVPASHLNGSSRLSEDEHLRSISVDSGIIRNIPEKTVYIVLDDIYTKGNTMRACRRLLIDIGKIDSSKIYCLTLGKTTYSSIIQRKIT